MALFKRLSRLISFTFWLWCCNNCLMWIVHHTVYGCNNTVMLMLIGCFFVPHIQFIIFGRAERCGWHGNATTGGHCDQPSRRRRYLRRTLIEHSQCSEAAVIGPSSFHHFVCNSFGQMGSYQAKRSWWSDMSFVQSMQSARIYKISLWSKNSSVKIYPIWILVYIISYQHHKINHFCEVVLCQTIDNFIYKCKIQIVILRSMTIDDLSFNFVLNFTVFMFIIVPYLEPVSLLWLNQLFVACSAYNIFLSKENTMKLISKFLLLLLLLGVFGLILEWKSLIFS